MKHICFKVETTAEAADIVALILIEEGSEGVSVLGGDGFKELQLLQKDIYWDYIDESIINDSNSYDLSGKVFVSGFFEASADLSVVKQSLSDFKDRAEIPVGTLAVTTEPLEAADYENEWKKYYSVTEFEDIAVVPQWLSYDGSLPALKLNPGKAFGTGMHETTAMCLSFLKKAGLKGKKVLDIGCGSGILGLAALKTGAKSAVLTDIDPQATEAALENAKINGLADSADIRLCDLAEGVYADVVFANLTADILLGLRPQIDKLLKKGGRLILSGVIEGREAEIESAFDAFELTEKSRRGPWAAYLYKRK